MATKVRKVRKVRKFKRNTSSESKENQKKEEKVRTGFKDFKGNFKTGKARFRSGWDGKARFMALNSIFTFGKHKGNTLLAILYSDMDYVDWAIQSGAIILDSLALRELERIRDDRRKAGFENNYTDHESRSSYRRSSQSSFDRTWENFANSFRSPARPKTEIKIVSPAAQWDHLPDREKHAKILRMKEVVAQGRVTKSQIRGQYKKLCLEYHADKYVSLGEEAQKLAHEMMIRINAAYDYYKRVYSL